jgi:hypothetical protein
MPSSPKEGEEKDCVKCGHSAIFYEKPRKPGQLVQIGDHIPPAGEYWPTPGWVCTVNENHFEPVG